MITTKYFVYTEGVIWSCHSTREDEVKIVKVAVYKPVGDPDEVPVEDLHQYLDLSNEEDEVAKYMSENHSEIKRILCGEHEKYKFYGVVIKADGRIELAFSIDGMLNIDKIPVVLDNNPCFTVETDEVLQRYVTITVTPVQGRHMTVITESQLGMTYRHINTGWQNQKTVAYYENIE